MQETSRQILYLLRHAKTEPWTPGIDDFERVLSRQGRQHMRQLSAWARESLAPPEIILCSPSARTRETLALVSGGWIKDPAANRIVPEIYEASAGTLHGLADAAFGSAGSVMMVGHNPGFERLAKSVLGRHDGAAPVKMPSGTLLVIDFRCGWNAGAGRGSLRHCLQPLDLLEAVQPARSNFS